MAQRKGELFKHSVCVLYSSFCPAAWKAWVVRTPFKLVPRLVLFAQVSERVIGAVYGALSEAGVFLEGTLLKPQMIMAGVDAPEKKVRPKVRAGKLYNTVVEL